MEVGQVVRVHRRVPFFGGRTGRLHKLGRKMTQVILANGIILDLRPHNVTREQWAGKP